MAGKVRVNRMYGLCRGGGEKTQYTYRKVA